MATLKAVIRKQRADGFFVVYICIVHRSRMGYTKTEKIYQASDSSCQKAYTGSKSSKMWRADRFADFEFWVQRSKVEA